MINIPTNSHASEVNHMTLVRWLVMFYYTSPGSVLVLTIWKYDPVY